MFGSRMERVILRGMEQVLLTVLNSHKNPQTLMLRASSNAELSLTPRYADVAVILLCPSKIPISRKIHLNTKSIKVLTYGKYRSIVHNYEGLNRQSLV